MCSIRVRWKKNRINLRIRMKHYYENPKPILDRLLTERVNEQHDYELTIATKVYS